MEKEGTKKGREAKYWALRKWHWIWINDGETTDIFQEIPKLKTFYVGCSYCEIFNDVENQCIGCPIRHITSDTVGCMAKNHPYYKWWFNNTKENAYNVLCDIYNSAIPKI